MMPGLQVKTPLFPVISILSGITVFFAGLLFVKEPWFPFYLAAVGILYVIFGYGRVLWKATLIFAVLGGITFGITMVFSPAQNALQNFYRMFLLGLSAVPTVSMPPIDLVRCMNQMHIPRWLTLGLLICIRFFGILGEEFRRIRTAMRLRGISAGHPAVWYRAMIIPFMMRLFSISDMLSLSLETRGFQPGMPASIYRPVRFKRRDFVYAVLLTALIGVSIYGKVAL